MTVPGKRARMITLWRGQLAREITPVIKVKVAVLIIAIESCY